MAPEMENRPLDMLNFKFKNNIEVSIPYCEIANGDLVEIIYGESDKHITRIVIDINGTRETYVLDVFLSEMENLLARGKVRALGIKLATEEEYRYFDISSSKNK
jgi:hypothetical protein